jgi:hypothetical protein
VTVHVRPEDYGECTKPSRRRASSAAPVTTSTYIVLACDCRRPRRARPWSICGLRDDVIVPLICPTCQNVFRGEFRCLQRPLLLCMGLFSIFWFGGYRVGRSPVPISPQDGLNPWEPSLATITSRHCHEERRSTLSAAASSAARTGRGPAPSRAAASALPPAS